MEGLSLRNNGYTIIELMIVLVVSAGLFGSAVAAYSQQNRRTQFTESVQTFAQNLEDIINDIETGYYPATNFACTAPSTGDPNPNTAPGSAELGTNSGCIFLGKAIRFTNDADFSAYTVVGRRLVDGTTDKIVSSLNQARPVASTRLIDTKFLSADVQVIRVSPRGTNNPNSGFAIVSDSGVSGEVPAGYNTRASIALVPGTINIPESAFRTNVHGLNSTSINNAAPGIDICLQEGSAAGGRQAIISIGQSESKVSVDVRVDEPC